MEIAEFLLARIADDEAAGREMVKNKRWLGECGEPHDERIQIGDWTFNGPRLLAECEAKRQVAERYQKIQGRTQDGDLDEHLTLGWVLERLALPHADHPDYNPDWKP